MTRARDLADSADKDIAGTLTLDGLTVDKSQNSETNIELTNTNAGSDAQVRTKYTTDGGLFTVGKTSDAHAFGGDAYVHNVDNTNIRFATSDTERMRIDSSGNLLVGKTSAAYNTDGFETHPNGETYVSRSGTPMAINRNSSDGTLLNFYKDGAAVGSIGTSNGGDLYIGNDDTGLLFAGGSDMVIPWNPSGPSSRDNSISIGSSSNRFEHLFLSGNVTANALVHDGDDNTFIHFPSADTLAVNTGGSERLRLSSTGHAMLGTTSDEGASGNTQKMVAGHFTTKNGVTSIANTGVATTLHSFASNAGNFIVSALASGTGNIEDNTTAIIHINASSTSKITTLLAGSRVVLSMSGTNLQVTQSVFNGANINWSVMRIR